MKEVIAIIRRDRLPDTKRALEELNFPSLTIQSVDGRGKQKGNVYAAMDTDVADDTPALVKLRPTSSTYALEHSLPKAVLYVPKRMITIVVPSEVADRVVETIIKVNQSGQHGDGKIFVCPVDGAIRIRTGQSSTDAI
ncbi:P-II family nitrogen regulator [Candidatus Magnetobacterium casense]|uniref:P-II family nitrogen regulator n=1 Tax=Candidatus Magnetobacterium casense TaxID=1455061 RepID=A0ABS6RZW5_9BACT|nr:P-II family nitrogen regulator [Candidatus Magnetobacterium casensis]MBV6342147.1 P-II family nitrogen regulator [Candidatus Magnetobacterium casensis]